MTSPDVKKKIQHVTWPWPLTHDGNWRELRLWRTDHSPPTTCCCPLPVFSPVILIPLTVSQERMESPLTCVSRPPHSSRQEGVVLWRSSCFSSHVLPCGFPQPQVALPSVISNSSSPHGDLLQDKTTTHLFFNFPEILFDIKYGCWYTLSVHKLVW